MSKRISHLLLSAACASALGLLALLFIVVGTRAHDAMSASTIAVAAPASQVFAANLSSANEVPATESIAAGRAIMTLVTDTLHYRLFVTDIDKVTMAHIHIGAPGVNGPVIVTLYNGVGTFDPATPISGTVTLTPTQVADLLAGNYYVNVHSQDFPGGEIRGQLGTFTPPKDYNALLLGRNETPPVTTAASGIARLTLVATDTLNYQLSVSNLVSVTAQHIHLGPVGVAGPVIFPLPGSLGPNSPISGTLTLSAQNLLDLLTGYYYVNVHTTPHPGGEIRGQVGGPRLYQASLSGASEVPSILNTAANGSAVLALSADTTKLYYRVTVDNIQAIQMAHIHLGKFGQNGPVIFPLFPIGSAPFAPGAPISGTLTITPGQVTALITGNYYVNVHTTAHPGGAMRGQVGPATVPTHFSALLTGAEQTPPVASNGLGLARLTLMPNLDTLHYTLAVSDITGLGAAHIHLGARGQAGNVIFPFNTTNLDPTHPIGDGLLLDGKQMVDLLTGYYYVNVHTPAHGSGEIRGQIGGAHLFHATLDGAHEVPPVATPATGEAVLALDADTSVLYYRLWVNDISGISAAHIHKGVVGQNGPVIYPLYMGVGAFDPSNPVSGTLPISTSRIFDLLAGNHYVNVHTATHGNGEMRGQVQLLTPPTHFVAMLTGAGEVPTKTTNAMGLATFALDLDTSRLNYTLNVTDIISATMAHIHIGSLGKNGPVLYGLFNVATGGGLDASHAVGGGVTIGGKDLVDLLTNFWYVNVHTVANPGGEIRGQIITQPRNIHLPLIIKN